MIKKDWLIILLVSLLVGIAILFSYNTVNESQLQQYLIHYIPDTPFGIFKLYALLAVATALGLPRQIAAFCAGYSFDLIIGFLVATTATLTGCILTYLLAKYCLYTTLMTKYPEKICKIQSFFRDDLFVKALIIRLIPAGSNFLTNLLAGSANISARPYFLGSLVGYLPQMLVFTLAGYGIKLGTSSHLIISGLLFLTALIIGIKLYQRHKKRTT